MQQVTSPSQRGVWIDSLTLLERGSHTTGNLEDGESGPTMTAAAPEIC